MNKGIVMKIMSIFLVIITSILLVFTFNSNNTSDVAIEKDCSGYAGEVFCLTNEARNKVGKRSLIYSYELEQVSMAKSKDMCKRKYFSHDYKGESWTKFIKQSGVNYRKAGENLANGYSTPQKAIQGLIDSPKHYENIIGDYTHIGVYTEPCGGLNLTTQTFAKL